MRPGPNNSLTDVHGLKVGCAEDHRLKSGVTVVTGDAPFTAAVHVMGGAPGTRETELLAPDRLVQQVDALVLSGGSVFGLDAASGVTDALADMGRGFAVGPHRAPIVPAAILFDLNNGGDKTWTRNPYRALGEVALNAAGNHVPIGSVGAGVGATTRTLKGGLGTASAVLENGHTVGAVVAVNALGDATVGNTHHFWAAPFEFEAEFGGHGTAPSDAYDPKTEAGRKVGQATTIAVIATDADLSQAQATRLAISAHDGFARALVPSHTPLDGDLVFAAAMGTRPLTDPVRETMELGHAAATCMARAIARGVWSASGAPDDPVPSWSARFAPT